MITRINGTFSGGTPVTLAARSMRQEIWFQNQSASNTMSVAFASGFTIVLQPGATLNRSIMSGPGATMALQGVITITGTNGDSYDGEEIY